LRGAGYCDAAWRRELAPGIESSIVNWAIYGALGNRGYRWLLRAQSWSGDARGFLGWLYGPGRLRRVLLPWARRKYRSRRGDRSCDHIDCACVWCRCGGADRVFRDA